MTILEFLASQLDREISDFEKKAPQQIFTDGLDFWQLCLTAREILQKEKSNVTDNTR